MAAMSAEARVGRFRRYPAYRDSGVEWLGEIPERWDIARLKGVASIRYGLGEPPGQLADGVPFIRATNVAAGRIVEREMLFVDPREVPFHRNPVLRPGDIIVVRSGAYTGDSAIIPPTYDGAIAGYDMVVRPQRAGSEFVAWALLSDYVLDGQIKLERARAAQPHLNAEELGRTLLAVPSELEQRSIAAFLDRETARIDALVAQKERLIELLQEKRTALITRAVTKGLDPDVEMKESGVEWMGEVPAHWEVKQLRWAILFQRGHDLPADEREDGDVPVVSSSGISSSHSRATAKAPGIVTGRYGTIGSFHLVWQDYWPLNTTLYSIDLRSNDPTYLFYLLSHLSPLFLLNSLKSAVPGVDRNDIHPITTAVPAVGEQRDIVVRLNRESARIESLVAKVREAITRLKELRTALISAAVTGKIDVREDIKP